MRPIIVTIASIVAFAQSPWAQLDISVAPDRSVHLYNPSATNREYFLERSLDLTTWSRQGMIILGSGSNLMWTNTSGNSNQAFYRLWSAPLISQRLYGLDVSPYLDGQNPNLHTPIPRAQIEQRMRLLVPYTDWIRTFSMNDGLQVSGQVAHQLGFKSALGAWLGPESTPAGVQANQTNINNLIAAGRAGEADLLIVGSEVLLRTNLSASSLVAYMNQVRAAVPGVPVTTADVYGQLIDPINVQVINACDLLMVNIYPFWESQSIDNALNSLYQNFLSVKLAANGKAVWISEAGWPSAGQTVGAAVPSATNASEFFGRFVSWARVNNVPFFYFDAFDETWKQSTGEGAVGANWGVWNTNGVLKSGMQPIFDNQSSPTNWNATINGAGTPAIVFTSMPSLGSTNVFVSGAANHVAPFDVFVALYIKVNGLWYEKPYSNQPFTAITTTGAWTIRFATGGSDGSASEFAAYLFPNNYTPPHVFNAGTLPSELNARALAFVAVPRP